MLNLWLTIICLSTIYVRVEGQDFGQCDCMPPKPGQNIFCDSDFVIQAYIKSVKENEDGSITYKIIIIEAFKMPKKVNKRILIQPADSTCTKLEKKEVYVLSGLKDVSSKNLLLKGCRYTVLARDVSCNELSNLRFNFTSLCGVCRVDLCGDDANCNCTSGNTCINTKDNCLFKVLNYPCYRDHSLCMKDDKGRCNWRPILGDTVCRHTDFFPFNPEF